MSEKTCSACGVTQPVAEFQRRSHSSDGLMAACRGCCRERNRRYRKENREAIIERERARRAARSPEQKRAAWRSHYERNRERILTNNRQWKEANPEKVAALARRSWLAREYGVTLEQYEQMYAEQGGVCAICGAEPGSRKNHDKPNLAVDHDHSNGRVRGLLCLSCNGALGLIGESNIDRVLAYLGVAL